MALHVKALAPHSREEFDGFYAIYSTAFPPSEQKSYEALLRMQTATTYTIYLAFYDEKIVGFCIMYHPHQEDFYLLEYMAIDETKRGIGLGSTLLEQSIEQLFHVHGIRPLLIEIDSPEKHSFEQDIREKRERFYRHLGALKIDPFDYILPLQTTQEPPPMELLVYHPSLKILSKETLHLWLEKLYVNVYGCAKEDARIAHMLAEVPPILNLI